jgi:tetraacyldisaccharide 4'-kinase
VPSWWLTRGVLARLLLPLAWFFGALTAARRALYRTGLLAAHKVDAPVIVVGNLIAGGAGKTPVVLALVELLRHRGYTPGVVSRGYGGAVDGVLLLQASTPARLAGDEPTLLHLRSRAPVAVGRDRVAAARALLHAHPEVDVLISDDGLQHWRLARDAQVLVFDERGAGNGWLMPAGPLRESMPDRLPPRTLVVYNAGAPTTPLPGGIGTRRLQGLVALADWRHGGQASGAALDTLRGRPVVAAAGVARPERFFSMLRERGLAISPLPLPDHHPYITLPWPADTPDVVVTEKDAIKLDAAAVGRTRVWVAPLDFSLGADFAPALLALLPLPRSR